VDAFSERRSLLFDQFGRIVGGYGVVDDWEFPQWAANVPAHAEAVAVWLAAENLIVSAFSRNAPYHSGADEGDVVANDALAIRLQSLLLASRAAKPALDLVFASYYTEALTLERSMLEGWARSLYAKLKPSDHARWNEPYVEFTSDVAPKREPDWGEVKTVIVSRGTSDDKRLLAEAQLRWDFLNAAVHPSGLALAPLYDEQMDIVKFLPEYDRVFCTHALAVGVFVLSLILREIADLASFPSGWQEDYSRFRTGADVVAD
jgi:hypothetical protein